MKLVFRNFKRNWYSIAYLIGVLDSSGLDVDIHVADSLEEVFKHPEDSIVAYSLMTFDMETAEREIPMVKERGYTVIAGGPHPSADPESLLNLGVDYVFTGDGEKNLIEFIRGSRPNSGVFDGMKERVNLDDYPPFSLSRKLFIPMEISRGCPFGCGYCFTPILSGRRVRYRSVESVLYYAKKGVEMGRRVARFISSNSFGYMSKGVKPNLDALDRLLSGLRKIGIEQLYFGTFPSDVRPESVNEDVLRLVKEYVDNKSIIIGVQSGSDRILKMINRGHDVETAERAISLVREAGFIPHVDFIFGFPFETEEDVRATFDFIDRIVREYGAKIHAHTFMPLPGTPLARYGPGVLTKDHYRFLGKLSASGVLDGYWHKQAIMSERIARYAVGSGSAIT